jgi:GNAT superfamily N-acetyltransferase
VASHTRLSPPGQEPQDVRIRRAATSDAAEIARLGAQLSKGVDAMKLRACLAQLEVRPTYFLAVAEAATARLLGWIQVERRLIVAEARERAEIMALVVDETSRRLGIGTRLVEAAQRWAHLERLPQMLVRSNVVRDASHAFYARLGFGRVKTQHVYTKTLALAAESPTDDA